MTMVAACGLLKHIRGYLLLRVDLLRKFASVGVVSGRYKVAGEVLPCGLGEQSPPTPR